MLIFYLGILFYVVLLVGLIATHFVRLRSAKIYEPTTQFAVAVIVPVKGSSDPRFKDNLLRIINQVYAGPVQFVFSVESQTDTALPILQLLARQFEHVQVCVAGPATQSSQKIFNILQGMACIAETDILLIADADVYPHATWLQEMIAPFQDDQISATTGYYRRVPSKRQFQLGDYLAGIFNAVLIILTADNHVQSLWGGSMALRKSIMDKYNLYDYLTTQIVDDLALMQALHQYRLKRHFVPGCILKSYCDMPIGDSIEWLARQFQYIQIYFKGLYWLLALAIFPCALLMLALPFVFVYGLVSNTWPVTLGSTGIWLMVMAVAWLLRLSIPVNSTSIAPNDDEYRLLLWLLVAPLAAIGGGYALLKTFFRLKNGLLTIHWRGITYQVNIQTKRVIQIVR